MLKETWRNMQCLDVLLKLALFVLLVQPSLCVKFLILFDQQFKELKCYFCNCSIRYMQIVPENESRIPCSPLSVARLFPVALIALMAGFCFGSSALPLLNPLPSALPIPNKVPIPSSHPCVMWFCLLSFTEQVVQTYNHDHQHLNICHFSKKKKI